MISVINYTVRFPFTALFVIINNFLKRCHQLKHHLKKKLIKETKLVLYWIIERVIPLVLALLYRYYSLTSENTLAHFWLLLLQLLLFLFISVIENCFFFYGCNKFLFLYMLEKSWLDLTWVHLRRYYKNLHIIELSCFLTYFYFAWKGTLRP